MLRRAAESDVDGATDAAERLAGGPELVFEEELDEELDGELDGEPAEGQAAPVADDQD